MEPKIIDLNNCFESAAAACVALDVSHATLYRRIANGELRTIRLFGKQLIAKSQETENKQCN